MSKIKKVLFVAGSFNQGGAEYQLLTLAELMQSKNHEVFVLALTDYDFFKSFLDKNKIQYSCLSNSDSSLKRIVQLSRFIRKFRPDAIISYMKVPSMASIIARALSRVPCKLLISERTALVLPVRDFFHFSLWHFADVVTTNSITKVEYFKRNFPRIHKRLHLITNIYGNEVFEKPIKQDNIFQDDGFHFVFVGRISPEKNLDMLVRALSILKRDKYNFTLHLYGDARNPVYLTQLNAVIDNCNLRDQIIFHGATSPDKLKVVYGKCDLVCLLSAYEGFSNVLAEVLINGSIALTSNIAENAFIIQDNINGFLVKNDDSTSIANGFFRFLKMDNIERQQMKNNNKLRANSLFDRSIAYKKIIGLLDGNAL